MRVPSVRISGPLVVFTVAIAIQAAFSYSVTWREVDLIVPSLESLPAQIGSWSAAGDLELDPEVRDLLKPDSYVNRNYLGPDSESLNLFVAYFRSQRTGPAPHSPQMCLPGAGWLPRSHHVLPLPTASGDPISVNQYVLEKGRNSIVVIYWYQNHKRAWSEESQTKFQILRDFFADRRSDVALVRVVMPLTGPAGQEEQLFRSGAAFAKEIHPLVAAKFVAAGTGAQ